MKFDIGQFYGDVRGTSNFSKNRTKITGILQWISKCVLYCWQRHMQYNNTENALLCFQGDAFNIYDIVDSDL